MLIYVTRETNVYTLFMICFYFASFLKTPRIPQAYKYQKPPSPLYHIFLKHFLAFLLTLERAL